MTIQQRSGRTTEPSGGGGGRGRGHRGEPPPPFAKAYGGGCRANWDGARLRGRRHVKSAPSPYPTSEGVGPERGGWGWSSGAGAPPLHLPPPDLVAPEV